MAHMSQQNKKEKEPRIKAICKKYGVKGTVSVDNHSTLVLTLQSGSIDFLGEYAAMRGKRKDHIQITRHGLEERYTGATLSFLQEVFAVMNEGNHVRSDPQSAYFEVGWYTEINIGKWNKPYVVTTPAIPMLRVKESASK